MEMSRVMVGGEGPESYFRNSKLQGEISGHAKSLLIDGIVETLELKEDLRVFCIADLGCSVGPNTFSCVETVIDAVKLKYCKTHRPEGEIPEFQVFFNDQVGNDFNTLFRALPCDREYMAAGVPGTFYGRIFPKSSIHMMNSSAALQWLSKVPDSVATKDSPLWNKGKITYARSSSQIAEAFRAQFFSDMKDFLNARSEELVPGGLLAILMSCRPQGTSFSEDIGIQVLECLGDALADMVEEGLTSDDLVDSLNIPMFFPTASEIKEIVTSMDEQFGIERWVENKPPNLGALRDIQLLTAHTRAVLGGILSQHFGPDVVDGVFVRFPRKLENLAKMPSFTGAEETTRMLFLLLKRK